MTFSIRVFALLCLYYTHSLAVYAQRVPLPSPGPSDAILLSEGWLCQIVAMPEFPGENTTRLPLPERWSCFVDDGIIPNSPYSHFKIFGIGGVVGALPRGWSCRGNRNAGIPSLRGENYYNTVVPSEGWRCGGSELLVPPEGWRCVGSDALSWPPSHPGDDEIGVMLLEGWPWRCLSR